MSALEELAAELAQDVEIARRRRRMVRILTVADRDLRELGFSPAIERSKTGLFWLRIDPDQIDNHSSDAEPSDPPDTPVSDPDNLSGTGDRHDACEPPAVEVATPEVDDDVEDHRGLAQLPARERMIERRMRRIGYPDPHSPQSDLALFDALFGGRGMAVAAERSGLSRAEAVARFKAILPSPTIDGQAVALAVLKRRALESRAAE